MMERWGAFVARRALAVLLAGVALVIGGRRLRLRRLRPPGPGRLRRPRQRVRPRADARARDLRQPDGRRGGDLLQRRADRRSLPSSGPRSRGPSPTSRRTATSSVVSYYDTKSPDMVSKDGHAVQVQISLAGDSQDDLLDNWDEVEPALETREPPDGSGRLVRGLRRRQRDHLGGPRARRDDLAADRDPARAADLRQPGGRVDARPGRSARGRRLPRRGPVAHHVHRRVGLLGQRDQPARHGPGHRLRPVRDQPLPRGAGAAAVGRPGRVDQGDRDAPWPPPAAPCCSPA